MTSGAFTSLPRLPRHVAVIMDGNGRWATQRGLPRIEGHKAGVRSVRAVVECAREVGIQHITLYAFSSENWGRPPVEVGALMGLLRDFLLSELPLMNRHGIRLNTIGEASKLPLAVRTVLEATKAATAGNDKMTLTLALSYGSRDEIVRAVRSLAKDVASGLVSPESVNDEAISSRLDTVGIPDPDLLIRTSGEVRISNFLLWQAAYAEMVFVDTLWPDFGKAELLSALEVFSRRERRFGLTGIEGDDEGGG